MSDYGINLKVSSNGGAEIKKLFDQFKNLEKQIDDTQAKLDSINQQNKKLKESNNALAATYSGLSKGVKETLTFLTSFSEIFIKNNKQIKENNKALKQNKTKLKETKEARQVSIKQQLDETKAFQQSSNTIMKSSRQLGEYIKQLHALKRAVKGGPQKDIISDSITKTDFTKQFRDLEALTKAANRTARAYNMMFQGGGGLSFGQGRGISELLKFDPGNTEKAINSYIKLLRGLQVQLDKTSQEYRETTARIQQMNQALNTNPFDIKGVSAKEGDANFYGPKPSRKTQMFNMPGGMFYEPGGMAARRRGALNSALIGGAFPALFGQGLGASIGGGLGGGVGGMLGGGLGFGLSLVGTQIGAQFDRLVQSMNKAGTALADFNKDTDQLIESLGLTNSQTALRIKNLKELNGEQAAYDAALAQMTAIVGEEGVQGFKTFADETRQISTDFQQLFLIVGASLARLISFTRILKGLTDGINNSTLVGRLSAADNSKAKDLASEIEGLEKRTSGKFSQRLSKEEQRRLKAAREEARELLKTIELDNTRKEGFKLITKEMEKQQKINNTFGFRERERIKNEQKINELAKKYFDLTKEALSPDQIAKLEAMVAAQSELVLGAQLLAQAYTEVDKKLIELNDSGFQIVKAAEAIGSAFSESFKGIIKGTMSVREAFANMFSRIADHFLDMAAQMAAAQLQKGILSLFNFGANPVNNFGGMGVKMNSSAYEFDIGPDPFKAKGGPVTGGSPYIVGEKGPELFVPGSSGNIVPNHAMGGANVVVNVDASGSSVQGNAGQSEELGRMLAAAVQSELVNQQRPGGLLAGTR